MTTCGHDASWHAGVFFQKGAISGIVREPPVLPTGDPGGPWSFGEPIRLPLPGPVIAEKGCLPPLDCRGGIRGIRTCPPPDPVVGCFWRSGGIPPGIAAMASAGNRIAGIVAIGLPQTGFQARAIPARAIRGAVACRTGGIIPYCGKRRKTHFKALQSVN